LFVPILPPHSTSPASPRRTEISPRVLGVAAGQAPPRRFAAARGWILGIFCPVHWRRRFRSARHGPHLAPVFMLTECRELSTARRGALASLLEHVSGAAAPPRRPGGWSLAEVPCAVRVTPRDLVSGGSFFSFWTGNVVATGTAGELQQTFFSLVLAGASYPPTIAGEAACTP